MGISWYAVANFIATPIYLHLLGIEAYGLLGIYNSLYAATILLDLGISPAINREFAQLSVSKGNETKIRILFKTVESVYWIITVAIGLVIVVGSPLFSKYWVHSEIFTTLETRNAFMLMGISLIFQLPVSFYSNVFFGLHRHITLNIINICATTFRFAFSILGLIYFKTCIEVFFATMAISSLLHFLLLRIYAKKNLPATSQKIYFPKLKNVDLEKYIFWEVAGRFFFA